MTERALPVYAFDRWTVKPGNEAAFVVAWTALIDWTLYAAPGFQHAEKRDEVDRNAGEERRAR
jgi:hypothetical protein